MTTSRLFVSLFCLALVSGVSAACGGDDDGGGDQPTVDASGGGGAAPAISEIAWTFSLPCTINQTSEVEVAVTVTDSDNTEGQLTFAGSVAGCGGQVTTNPATLTCPNAAPYSGTITVTDPDDNSDSLGVTINPCTDGSAP